MASGYFPTFSYTEYTDNLSEYTKDVFSHGVVCGCTGKIYNNRTSFITHIKSKKHNNWIKSLNDEVYKQHNNSTYNSNHKCIICTDSLNKNPVSLPCAHTFHANCISRWLKIKPECPVCKSSV